MNTRLTAQLKDGRLIWDAPAVAAAELARLGEKRVTVTIETDRQRRSNQANARYWACIVPVFQEIWSHGRPVPYTREEAHSVLKAVLLGEDDGKELRRLLEAHRQAVAGQFYDGEGYAPVMGQDEDGRAQGNAWAIGFVRGMALRPDAWDELEEDDEFADALDPLMRLVEEVDPEEGSEPLPVSDEERGPLIEAMFEGVMEVYDYFRARRERNLAPPTIRRAAKVGRNDPCPCGSGKKYKQCCGAAPATH